MANSTTQLVGDYKFGFAKPEKYVFKARKGLDRKIVEEISYLKEEPDWMRDFRLKAYDYFIARPQPTWGGDLSKIKYDDIYYYIKPVDKQSKSWDELPKEIRDTYDKIGIPEAEKKLLGGVGAQYDSEVVYHSLKKQLEDKGVIFCDTDSALKRYPDLFIKYFGKIVPPNDNKLAALNSAVWSGGSFIYVPKGVKVDIPLQAYFRINAANMGQFERTLIIVDDGAEVQYVEGCFTKGARITTNPDYKPIEKIQVGDRVLTHTGQYKTVYHTQVRPYSGSLYQIKIWGDPTSKIEVTEEHPFIYVKRQSANERNSNWQIKWGTAKELAKFDYLAIPINQTKKVLDFKDFEVEFKKVVQKVQVPSTKEFFRLVGYYLAEGSVDPRGYLHFSFGTHETKYIKDVKKLLSKVFGVKKFYDMVHKANHGVSIVVASAKLTRIFAQYGTSSNTKKIPQWMITEDHEKQKELITGFYRGDGNYYKKTHKHGLKEIFRINTTSEILARQVRDILLRIGVVSFINKRVRRKDNRRTIFTIGIGGEFLIPFGKLVGVKVREKLNGKKRATLFGIDENYAYVPIKNITKKIAKDISVYNFSVEDDESYVANNVAVHNCTAPIYTTDSLHAAVVEIYVHKNAYCQYTTVQNWSNNVYNLVTKRTFVEEEGYMSWVDGNIGSKLTMKYPSVFLRGKGARGEILSLAYAGKGQHQDAGGKAIHLAPHTSSTIISKSISKDSGRTTYRGLLRVGKDCYGSKASVRCDALILDDLSRSDTEPHMEIYEDDVSIAHEASVGKIGEEQLFYLMSRGLSENEATGLIVRGFIEPIIKQIPLEYAVEMNRLIQLEMEGAIG